MDMMRKMMEIMGNMSEEERVQMMERCSGFMKGKESGKEKERDGEKKGESACFPDMGNISECCPELMETVLSKMKSCFEEIGKEEKNARNDRAEEPGCCQGNGKNG
jgi:DNA invertase Pin-like site-specific DNA recombinase